MTIKQFKTNYLSFRFKEKFFLNKLKYQKNKIKFNNVKQEEQKFCQICNSTDLEIIADVDRLGFKCKTVVCSKCSFVFNKDFVSNPSEFYKQYYGSRRWIDPYENFEKRIDINAFAWKRYKYLEKYQNNKKCYFTNILEIGCGDGCNLYPFFKNGKKVVGYDFGKKFLEPGNKVGMDLRYGDINSVKRKDFDLVMLVHSFEHFLNINDVIKSIGKVLSKNGSVYVEVPGILSMNRKSNDSKAIMGVPSSNNFLNYIQFEHNYHFTLNHLTYIWERNGFYLTQGDEGVRAIFKKKNNSKNYKSVNIKKLKNQNIIIHLKSVEKNFLTISNLLRAFSKKLMFFVN
jgi:SAM-dependent methyltransferase